MGGGMHGSANPLRRYRLEGAVYLTDAEERRYVEIAPDRGGYRVVHGTLDWATDPDEPTRLPVAGGDPLATIDAELSTAVQRVCALAADWLGFDEWEVERTRALFEAPPAG